jgi:hypothetical protein
MADSRNVTNSPRGFYRQAIVILRRLHDEGMPAAAIEAVWQAILQERMEMSRRGKVSERRMAEWSLHLLEQLTADTPPVVPKEFVLGHTPP